MKGKAYSPLRAVAKAASNFLFRSIEFVRIIYLNPTPGFFLKASIDFISDAIEKGRKKSGGNRSLDGRMRPPDLEKPLLSALAL